MISLTTARKLKDAGLEMLSFEAADASEAYAAALLHIMMSDRHERPNA